ncbi:MAG: hypothetical protein R2752_08710 [Vicinamibacterales bacterium]
MASPGVIDWSPGPGRFVRSAAWIAAAAAAVAAGAVLSPDDYLRLAGAAALLAAGLVAITVASRARVAGLALLLLVAVAVPLEVPAGGRSIGASVPIAMLLCATWVLRRVLAFRPMVMDRSGVALSLVAFLVVAVLAFIVGQYPWFPTPAAPMSAQLAGLALFLMSGGLFLVVAYDLRSVADLRRLTWLFVIVGAITTLLVMVPAPASLYIGRVIRPESIGSLFWTWIVAVSASQALCNRDLSMPARAALLAVVLLALGRGLGLAFSWASGWLPPLVALGTIVCLRFPWFSAGAALLAAAPAMVVGGPLYARLASGESYSLMTRLEALSVLGQVIARDPWLGLGPANYYYYTLLYPILGWYVRFSSHNTYIDLLAQTGVVGLLVFGWFAAAVAVSALRLRRVVTGGFEQAYLVGALGGLAGSLAAGFLADWIVPFAYNIGLPGFRSSLLFWVFLGGVVAIRRLAPRAPVAPRVPRAMPAVRTHPRLITLGLRPPAGDSVCEW